MKHFILVMFAIAAVVALPSNKALACSCLATTPEQIIVDSDVVFRGTVTSKAEGSLSANDVVTFRVESVVKGDVSNTTTITTPADSAACGVEYEIGQEYAVAATETDGELMSFLCSSITLQDLESTNECAPYVCRDGTVHPACSEDGHVINYFAEPCLTHGGEVGGPVSSFTDVRPNHPSYEAITWARVSGVVEGYADGTFRPTADVNRAEFVKILLETYDINVQALCRMAEFPDAPMQEWYGPYVHAARCHGIVSGYPDGTFRPGANINFAEAAKIVVNLHAGEPLQPRIGEEWYQVYLDYLNARNAVPTSIRANSQLVTRGEMVDIMYRLQLEEPAFCTADAMQCPDGSWVGRVPPTCEFAACPGEPVACTMDAKVCPDGSYVGRTGPNCEFAPCPGETSQRTNITLFFYSDYDLQTASDDASFVVTRSIPKTSTVADAAMRALLAGPTKSEEEAGARTFDALRDLADSYRGISIKNRAAVVKFTSAALSSLNSAAGTQLMVKAAIENTLENFPTVDYVQYEIDGEIYTEWDA